MKGFRKKFKGKVPTSRTQVKHIETVLRAATGTEWAEGLKWYSQANEWAASMGDTVSVAHACAILSSQCDWETNKLNTELVASLGPKVTIFASRKQKQEAHEALKGRFRIPPSRLKTYAFASLIANPYSDRLVIDRHAIQIAYGIIDAAGINITKKRYHETSGAYQRVAEKLNLQPSQVQAITWIAYKRIVNR